MTAAANTLRAPPAASDRAARAAVSAVFFQQGLLVGGWALHIPLVMSRLGIAESVMGLVIVVFGTGSIAAMWASGPFIDRHGSDRLTAGAAIAAAFFLLALSLAPGLAATMLVAGLVGALIGVTDLAMNANGVVVERRYGRAIMSAFHGFWSLGALVGALASGPIVAWIGGLAHAALFAALALALALWASPRLARDAPDAAGKESATDTPAFVIPRHAIVWLLGLVTLFSYVPEGAVIDWSALFLAQEIGAPVVLGGIAVASLSTTMTIMRFLGDRVRDRFGAYRTLLWGGAIAAIGFAVAGLSGFQALDWSWEARAALMAAGFVIAGLGLANIVPIGFAIAGNLRGVPSGVALSFTAMCGYGGILLAPSLIGWIGERTGFAPLFVALGLMPLTVALIAGRVTRPE